MYFNYLLLFIFKQQDIYTYMQDITLYKLKMAFLRCKECLKLYKAKATSVGEIQGKSPEYFNSLIERVEQMERELNG